MFVGVFLGPITVPLRNLGMVPISLRSLSTVP